MSTKPPADPPMERGANPVRPATAPIPRKPAAPPPQKSGFQRFVLQFLLLVIALGGAFGTGYLVNANEMQIDRNTLLQQQLDAQERIWRSSSRSPSCRRGVRAATGWSWT